MKLSRNSHRRLPSPAVASLLILTLSACSLPAGAQGVFNCAGVSGTAGLDCALTNALGNTNSTGAKTSSSGGSTAVTVAAIAGGAAAGLLILYIVKKRNRAHELADVRVLTRNQADRQASLSIDTAADPCSMELRPARRDCNTRAIAASGQAVLTILSPEVLRSYLTLPGTHARFIGINEALSMPPRE